ncbi:LOW QUALITY PROTEIN: hypothetical protein Cgig2_028490 [Carnegiea gigantea]|uniref:Uncharacterized protein n=1 Tax=Carnegiea gigantea TaxID=171969 RepID=A0A9Q1GQS0_9CARY|nr:LOW QUALITY PROTEIN: hypothetical protein Cgig2_028490 [Carnegiea gigantea]
MNLGMGRGLSSSLRLSSTVGSPKGFRTGFPSFQLGTSPQPDSRRRKGKAYFQHFSFDFFSMAITKPNLFLKQHHLKSPLRAAWYTAIYLAGGSFTVASGSGITKEYSAGKRYYFSRADLFSLGQGSDSPGRPCGSEHVGAPGNSNPSATISVTGGVRPFRLGTEPPGPNDDSGEELVKAPSADELLEECPGVELGRPPRPSGWIEEELNEDYLMCPRPVACPVTGCMELRLCHPVNLEVGHIVSYDDLPRVHHLHLGAKNAGGGGILAARPRGSAQLKKRNDIGNLFWLPILILSGDAGHHPTINKG